MFSSTSWGRRRDSLISITFALHLCRMTENFFHQKPLKSASFFRPSTSQDFLASEFKKSFAAVPHLPKCSNSRGVKDNEEVSGRTCARYLTLLCLSVCLSVCLGNREICVPWQVKIIAPSSITSDLQDYPRMLLCNLVQTKQL